MPDMNQIQKLLDEARSIWTEAVDVWLAGGWAMVAIAVTALIMFGIGMHVYLTLQAKRFASVPEKTWRRWINHPEERKGPIGDLITFVTKPNTVQETAVVFDELRKTENAPIERDLWVMKICVSAAPLLGLFGTVNGMLDTFSALSSGSGGDETMALVAEGISEALVTTETGLVVALPGLFFQYQLARKNQRYKAFLAQLQTVCAQNLRRTQPLQDRAE